MNKVIILFLCLSVVCRAEDWTINGKTYHNVVVGQIEADRVHVTYDGGLGALDLATLPPDLQKRFGYDPAKAKALAAKRAQAAAASDKAVQQAVAQQTASLQKNAALQPSDNSAANAARIAKIQAQIYALEDDIRQKERDEETTQGGASHGAYDDIILQDQREIRILTQSVGPGEVSY